MDVNLRNLKQKVGGHESPGNVDVHPRFLMKSSCPNAKPIETLKTCFAPVYQEHKHQRANIPLNQGAGICGAQSLHPTPNSKTLSISRSGIWRC